MRQSFWNNLVTSPIAPSRSSLLQVVCSFVATCAYVLTVRVREEFLHDWTRIFSINQKRKFSLNNVWFITVKHLQEDKNTTNNISIEHTVYADTIALREITHHQILSQLAKSSDLLVKEYQPKLPQFHLADPIHKYVDLWMCKLNTFRSTYSLCISLLSLSRLCGNYISIVNIRFLHL